MSLCTWRRDNRAMGVDDDSSSDLIDVAMLDLPRMSREIVARTLVPAPEIRLWQALDPADPPDVAIVGGNRGEDLSARALELINEYPRMKVLTLAEDGAETYVYELRPHRVLIGELSPDALLAAVLDVRKATR
jgi:hypothetical protein